MAEPNWASQTIWTRDNLEVMRGMNSASVDLIYLDPPFNSKHNYAAPIGSKAAGAAFKDTWGLDDVNLAWHGEIKYEYPGLYALLEATRQIHGDSMMSYLIYMAIRLMEMRRVLRGSGSIYLHCDPTASHYLKLLMDAVFGTDNFRNEMIWKRTLAKALTTRRLPSNHDVIFRYQSTSESTWNADAMYTPYDPQNLDAKTASKYRHQDSNGRLYQLTSLLNPNKNRPNLTYEFLGVNRVWRWTRARMQAAYDVGLVIQPRPGGVPRLKRYLDEQKGRPLGDVWTDIPPINSQAKERIGYPTQKPLALLDRIIEASSNPGDMVLDPFCGCATACIAAERRGREWMGIDISPKAADLVVDRMQQELGLFYRGAHREYIPHRTDMGKLFRYNDERNKRLLYGEQGGYCHGCETHFELRHFHVDHIIPRAKGGTDHISNLQLLCGHCNSVKGDRPQEYLLVCLTDKGWIQRRKAA